MQVRGAPTAAEIRDQRHGVREPGLLRGEQSLLVRELYLLRLSHGGVVDGPRLEFRQSDFRAASGIPHGDLEGLCLLAQNAQPRQVVLDVLERRQYDIAVIRDGALLGRARRLHLGMPLAEIEQGLSTVRSQRPDVIRRVQQSMQGRLGEAPGGGERDRRIVGGNGDADGCVLRLHRALGRRDVRSPLEER